MRLRFTNTEGLLTVEERYEPGDVRDVEALWQDLRDADEEVTPIVVRLHNRTGTEDSPYEPLLEWMKIARNLAGSSGAEGLRRLVSPADGPNLAGLVRTVKGVPLRLADPSEGRGVEWQLADQVASGVEGVLRSMENGIDRVPTESGRETRRDELAEYQQRTKSLRLLHGALRAREEVGRALEDVREASGPVSESGLAQYFGELGADERKRADRWRVGAFVAAVLAVAVTVLFLFRGDAGSAVEFGQKALVTLALFGVAGLAGRESRHHRRVAVWSNTRAVQLKTIGAYTTEMESEVRDDVRRLLAAGVFGPPPASGGSEAQLSPALEVFVERALAVGRDVGGARASQGVRGRGPSS